MKNKVKLFKRYGKERFLNFRITLAVSIHNLMNNGNLRSNSFKGNSDFNVLITHNSGYFVNSHIFSVYKNTVTLKLVFGVIIDIIVD